MLVSGDGSNEEGDSTTAAQTNQLSENVQSTTEGDAVAASIAANPGLGASTTRVTRVARREGLPPLDLQPCAPAPTQAQQADRIVALRNQIRYTFAIQPHILERHLRNNNWNVIEAADAFWEEEETARNSNVLPQDYDIPMGRTVETSRLRARTALHRRLNTGSRDTKSTSQTNSAIFGLLQRNHWVLSDAEEDYRAKKGNLDDIIDAYSSLRAPRPSAMEQDARLASFVSLTSTNSIYAARRHLQQHRWDYARAVDGWRRMRALPEDRAPKLTNTKGFVHETQPNDGLRYNNANHPPYPYSYWREALDVPDDDESSGPPSSTDGASDSSLSEIEDDMDKPTSEKSERNGYLIEYDPKPAVLNCPDPSKLRVEMIRKGDYKMVIFKGQEGRARNSTEPNRRFRWHDEEREDGEVYVEFDWSNPDHIRQLNKWRQQFHRRQAPVTIGPQVVHYHPLEEEFLWQKHAEHVEEEVGKGRLDPTDGCSFPLMVTCARKQKWADALNKRFAGQTDVDGVHLSDEPRPFRHFTSVDSARYRMQSIVRDFGVGFAQRRGIRHGLDKKCNTGKRLKAVHFESGSDEDDEDDIGESSGTNEGNYDRSSDSGAEAGNAKRKKHNKDNDRAEDPKKARRAGCEPGDGGLN
ncbi:hypothetical protein EPUS_07631 [Endocarpon pusillum Z07020]|uniref:Uncharacterized protein n=1 Tax=Endocarpon pusillum (strain Z07020 / HMAS-L-300199) TaxID=1263415 RepID=U1GXI7_ENDPU|nr:uncharacterized protein EPUS_07631 [Endocarpon pusillum Z07020]ERF76841.1 hypothetical protein EPUS_07631 [Endocarpon pusillum Z07020]